MRICINPNCGEPIEGTQCQGSPPHLLYLPKTESRKKQPYKSERVRRAQAYRAHQERLQDARIMAMMPLGKP